MKIVEWLKGRGGGCDMCWRTTVSMSILELMLEFGTCWYQFISARYRIHESVAREREELFCSCSSSSALA